MEHGGNNLQPYDQTIQESEYSEVESEIICYDDGFLDHVKNEVVSENDSLSLPRGDIKMEFKTENLDAEEVEMDSQNRSDVVTFDFFQRKDAGDLKIFCSICKRSKGSKLSKVKKHFRLHSDSHLQQLRLKCGFCSTIVNVHKIKSHFRECSGDFLKAKRVAIDTQVFCALCQRYMNLKTLVKHYSYVHTSVSRSARPTLKFLDFIISRDIIVDENDCTLSVTCIPQGADKTDLTLYFQLFGEIESINIVTDPVTCKPKGIALILFRNVESVHRAVATEDHIIKGQIVKVKKAEEADFLDEEIKLYLSSIRMDHLSNTTDQSWNRSLKMKKRLGKHREVVPRNFSKLSEHDDRCSKHYLFSDHSGRKWGKMYSDQHKDAKWYFQHDDRCF